MIAAIGFGVGMAVMYGVFWLAAVYGRKQASDESAAAMSQTQEQFDKLYSVNCSILQVNSERRDADCRIAAALEALAAKEADNA